MDEVGTLAAMKARIDFLETRVVALEAVAFPIGQGEDTVNTAKPVRGHWYDTMIPRRSHERSR